MSKYQSLALGLIEEYPEMTWTPIVGKAFTISELKVYINNLDFIWKPSLIVWHNTGLPTIDQWQKTADDDLKKGLIPGTTRINNLVSFFRDQQGWPSGPHFFVWKDVVWVFTPPNKKGTHSPSWNGIAIGIEMIADFSKEDDETGTGKLIKNNTIALTAILCEKLGINPLTGIKLHKEDKKTDHDCPGKHIAVDKDIMIDAVLEYMGHGGEHQAEPIKARIGFVNIEAGDTLNLREKSSASSNIITKLFPNAKVTILNEAMNGSTKWFYIEWGGTKGWVAAKYIKEN